MSGSEYPPPPGPAMPPPPGAVPPAEPARPRWGQPGPVPGGWGQPQPGAPYPPPASGPTQPRVPGMWGAAHKPGAMPLRPLGLGDIYDAAFKIIRFNPKATAGSAVIVSAVAMAIPVLATAVLTFTLGLTFDAGTVDASSTEMTAADWAGILGPYGALLVGLILQSVGTILVTGMIAHVTAAAAIGRRMSLGETWAATRGKRWRLIGVATMVLAVEFLALGAYGLLSFLLVVDGSDAAITLWFLFSVPLVICTYIFLTIRVAYLAPAALMLEDVGAFAAFGRAWRLSGRQFWRLFGISLLTSVIVGVAAQMLNFPFSIVTQVAGLAVSDGEFLLFFTVLGSALGQVLSAAFTVPFTAAVRSLQYLDQRMRKEAYDVELMTRAGITGA